MTHLTRTDIKQLARQATVDKHPQVVNGWSVYHVYISHRFGVSLWHTLRDRFGLLVVEVQGLDNFARLASKYMDREAPKTNWLAISREIEFSHLEN